MSADFLQSQHREITARLASLMQAVEAEAPHLAEIVLRLQDLDRKLAFHLQCEDMLLYPYAVRSPDASLAQRAKAMMQDMSHVSKKFQVFMTRWSSAHELAQHFSQFQHELHNFVQQLNERIRCEDHELYPHMYRTLKSAYPPPSPRSFP